MALDPNALIDPVAAIVPTDGSIAQLAEGISETQTKPIVGECFGFTASVDITDHTDPAIEMRLDLYASVDGGQTFDYAGGCSRMGGKAVGTDGNVVTTMSLTSFVSRGDGQKINLAAWTDPIIKQTITLKGGSVKSGILAVQPIPRTQPVEDVPK